MIRLTINKIENPDHPDDFNGAGNSCKGDIKDFEAGNVFDYRIDRLEYNEETKRKQWTKGDPSSDYYGLKYALKDALEELRKETAI